MTTSVVLLGTGTPRMDPGRAGAATAVVVDGVPYIFDVGPGVARRLSRGHERGIEGLAMSEATTAFITHHHSDHTAGLPELFLGSWMFQRAQPLRVFGPLGTEGMCRAIRSAYALDIAKRTLNEPHASGGERLFGLDVGPGPVYRDDRISVEAFDVSHGEWAPVHGDHPALGFRVSTADRTIIISGDTTWFPEMPQHYDGADTIVHEVYASRGLERRPDDWQAYHRAAHTSAADLGRVASAVQPELVVMTHQLLWDATPEDLMDEIAGTYEGRVHNGRDLDVV